MSVFDSGLFETLGALLAERVAERGTVGLALRPEPRMPATVMWTPAGDEHEPGFPAYSITKTLIATLVMQLVDAGRLALDDRLARWLPEIDRADRITLAHLLGHRAGIPDYGGLPAYHEAVRSSPGEPWSFEEFGARTFARGLDFEPGEAFAYSNPGYMLLVRILSEVTGQSLDDCIASRIARPLGLEQTFVAKEIADWSALAPGPSRLLSRDGSAVDTRRVYHPGWVSHGVVASTPSEILRFYEALFDGALVSVGSLEAMTRIQSIGRQVEGYGDPSYGLGLMGDPGRAPHGLRVGHNGGGPGYTASAFRAVVLPRGPATVCVMAGIEEDEAAPAILAAVMDVLARG